MDAHQIDVARDCLAGAHSDTLGFPESVRRLMQAGFEAYPVDYRRNSRSHYLPDGETLDLDIPHPADPVAAAFDAEGVASAVRWAQAGGADYTYAAFNRRVAACGCAFYLVSFPGRRVVYVGRTGEAHVEHFPN